MSTKKSERCATRRLPLPFWIATAALVCAVGTWCYLVRKTEWDARNLYQQALRLQVGTAPTEEVLDLLNTAPGRKYGFEACLAGLDGCTGTIYIANTPLSRLRIAPGMGFAVRLGVSKNKLTNRQFMMDLDGMYGKESYGEASVNERVSGPGISAFVVRGWSSGVLVNMTTDAPEDMKTLAYNFNFDCLVKIRGCKSYEEMLPILKRKDITGPNPWHVTNE